MKKKYIAPKVAEVKVDTENLLVIASEIGIGGKTDDFDARGFDLDFEDEEDY